MVRKVIKPSEEYLHIKVPKEYIGREVEVLIFGNNEIQKIDDLSTNVLLEKFKKITKNPKKIDPNIDIIKLDEDMNNALY